MNYGGRFDIDNKLKRLDNLKELINDADFWNEKDKADKIIKEMNELSKMTNNIKELKENVESDLELIDIVEEEDELLSTINEQLSTYEDSLENLTIFLLLNGEYDEGNCLLELHSGAGGTEACDWCNMLYRMYLRYLDKKGFKYEVLDYQAGDEVGIKSVTLKVKGSYAYGYLKCEKGVHRLVRLSPFDSANKRHTSFASIDVTPEIDKNIEIEINDQDLRIDVYRSSGCGGQGVNTTDSAVRITHLPTKIVVTCQNERSQIQNKEQAMKILKNKLYLLEMEKKEKELANIQGTYQNIEFGSQIRSYVMHPYSMVKDHRTNIETSNVNKVLDGDIDLFIEGYLKGGK